MASWLPWTKEYKVSKCLTFAKSMIHSLRPGSAEAYQEFEQKMKECQQGPCKHTPDDFYKITDRICPALSHVTSVYDAIQAVKS